MNVEVTKESMIKSYKASTVLEPGRVLVHLKLSTESYHVNHIFYLKY